MSLITLKIASFIRKNKNPPSQKFSHENCEFKLSVHVWRGKVIVYYGKRMSILSRGPSEIRYIVF